MSPLLPSVLSYSFPENDPAFSGEGCQNFGLGLTKSSAQHLFLQNADVGVLFKAPLAKVLEVFTYSILVNLWG